MNHFIKINKVRNYRLYGLMAFLVGSTSFLKDIFNLRFNWSYNLFWIIIGLFLMIGLKEGESK